MALRRRRGRGGAAVAATFAAVCLMATPQAAAPVAETRGPRARTRPAEAPPALRAREAAPPAKGAPQARRAQQAAPAAKVPPSGAHGSRTAVAGKQVDPMRFGQHRFLDNALSCLRSEPPVSLVTMLPPKTGSRHFMSIVEAEYGKKTPRGCEQVNFHARPLLSLQLNCTDDTSIASDLAYTMKWRRVEDLADRLISGRSIALVRDPVEQLLSYFSFVIHDWESRDWQVELEELAASPFAQNSQLAFITGRRDSAPSILAKDCHGRVGPPPSEEDFERARKRVESGSLLLGTVDRFEDSVRFFAERLRWRKFDPDAYGSFEPRGPETFNVNSVTRVGDRTRNRLNRSLVPPALLEKLLAATELDNRLNDLAHAQLPPPKAGGDVTRKEL